MYRPKVVRSIELTASSAASLGRVVQSPHSDVAWLEPHRYCWVPVATEVTSSYASPQGDDATNVAVASHGIRTWTGAIYGTVLEADIIGAAAYLLHTPPSACTVHVVDAGDNGELEPRVPSMQALQQVRDMEWRSLAARTRAHTPLAGACEAVPLGAVHHGPTHRNMLRARDGRLSTMQVMRRWRQRLTRMAIPAHPCIFCWGPEEDIGHMRLLCAQDEEVARLLCRRVGEFTAELPLTDRAVEFVAWREHGWRRAESLMAGVVPGDLKRLFAAVQRRRPGALLRPGSLWRTWSGLGKMCMPAGTIGSPRSCSSRCKIEGGRYTRSCEVTHPAARGQGGSSSVRRGTGLPASLATCGQPFRGHRCTHCWCHGRASRTKRPCPCSLTG